MSVKLCEEFYNDIRKTYNKKVVTVSKREGAYGWLGCNIYNVLTKDNIPIVRLYVDDKGIIRNIASYLPPVGLPDEYFDKLRNKWNGHKLTDITIPVTIKEFDDLLPAMYIKGDYVLSPCKNAFNDQISYWMSKRNCTKAIYCFTLHDDIDTHLAAFNSYIELYDNA